MICICPIDRGFRLIVTWKRKGASAMEQYQRKTILPGITLLYGFPEECCIWLVEGREKALLVDTGLGWETCGGRWKP